jgi:hypothetical protein
MANKQSNEEVNNYLQHLEEVLMVKNLKSNANGVTADPQANGSRADSILESIESCENAAVTESWNKIETASLVVLLRELLKTHYDSDIEMSVRSVSSAMSDVLQDQPEDSVARFWKKVQTASLVLLAKQVEAPGSKLRGIRNRTRKPVQLVTSNGSSAVYEKKH